MRRLLAGSAFLVALTTGCATVGEKPAVVVPPPAGRTLVVAVGLDAQNRSTVQALARDLAAELDDRWGSVFEANAFAKQAARYGVPVAVDHLEQVAAGTPLDPALVEHLKQTHRIQTVVFLDVRLFDQDWGQETKRTRIKLVAWALDLTRLAVLWRATSAPEVEGETGRSFQIASEIAIRELVRAIVGEPAATGPPTVSDGR